MEDKVYRIVCERLRARMTQKRLSGSETSRRAGLNVSYVNEVLSGKNLSPAPDKLDRLAEVLDCDRNWLAGGDPPNKVKSPERILFEDEVMRGARAIQDHCHDMAQAIEIAAKVLRATGRA